MKSHCMRLTSWVWQEVTPEAAIEVLRCAPGVEAWRLRQAIGLTRWLTIPRKSCHLVNLVGKGAAARYPMPLTSTKKYDVEERLKKGDREISRQVGRIRSSLVFAPRGLDLFISGRKRSSEQASCAKPLRLRPGDQLLRGAALNAVLIAEAKL